MAQNLRLLQRRIKTAKNIAQVARAMEMVSASKIKRAQAAVTNNKPYAERVTTLTSDILKHTDLEKFQHPYINTPESQNSLIIVISPDKGLCGSLNTNLFRKVLELDHKNVKYITVGKKAEQFCNRLAGQKVGSMRFGTTLPDYSIVYKLIEAINTEYVGGAVSKVQILGSQFQSLFLQEAAIKSLLPIEITHEEGQLPYVFEPKPEEMLQELLPYYLEVILYTSLLEAFTSEQAARMMAMQNAKNNALDIADYITLVYNKSRQERITNELLTLSNTI